jgi:cell wall-associated NlpC family hydrolase
MSDELRQRIVEEAQKWVGTPFHHEARLRGVGVDCGNLLAAVFEAVGLLQPMKIEHYPPDFMLHRSEEWYLSVVTEFAAEVDIARSLPMPGDVALFRFGRVYSHGGIVVNWPLIIHASAQDRIVGWGRADQNPLKSKPMKVFRHRALT